MASRRKQAEGIALLSMYNDDDEEDDDDEEMEDPDNQEHQNEEHREPNDNENDDEEANKSAEAEDALTPGGLAVTPQSSELPESTQPEGMGGGDVVMETEDGGGEEDGGTEVSEKRVDPLETFLPPSPKRNCPDKLQEKIARFIILKKRDGIRFNEEVRKKKDYRNPDFLLNALRYQDIDQIGSCFNKDVFDPHGYDKSDYYDEIEADMRRERERKEQELKKSPKVEFIPGGTQPGIVVPPSKFSIPIPGVSAIAVSALPSAPTAADAAARDGRPNKKSKWDKVDGSMRNPLPTGGPESLTSVAPHAALLSAANLGAGYSAFVQQKRREAEVKRSSERKLDRRS